MIKITLQEAITHYREIYMASRNFAGRTRVEYLNDLDNLLRFLTKLNIQWVTQVSFSHLEQYLAELDQRGYAGSTRKRKVASIKSFFCYIKSDNMVRENVALRLSPPRSEDKNPRVLSEMEYKQLLRACAYETRDAAIIELFLQTGIRLTELTRLTLDDIELPVQISHDPQSMGLMRILCGKGRKDRSLPLNYKACKALKGYLRIRPKVEAENIFINKFGNPLGSRGVQLAVQKYLKEANIKGASVHSLRHTFGTHHVAKGTNLRTIQEAMGHKDLKTTSIYVSLARVVMNKELQENAL